MNDEENITSRSRHRRPYSINGFPKNEFYGKNQIFVAGTAFFFNILSRQAFLLLFHFEIIQLGNQ